VNALILLSLLSCKNEPVVPTPPTAGALMVGSARVRMPVPLGIGTAGYGGFGVVADPSPFSEIAPATTGIHNHPDFRAMAISRGEGFEVIFLRSDTIGMFQQLRRAVVLEVLDRTGRDIDDALIIGATHTHSGPGRLIDGGGPYDLIADRFFPEFYQRMVDAMADTVIAAIDDLQPGRVGYALASAPDAIGDRRCEDGLTYENPTMPVIAIEQGGTIKALQVSLAIHGTVQAIDDLLLSQDVSGGIEQAVQDRFGQPVQVQMFNSWGADMAPGNPDLIPRDGAAQREEFDRIERVGVVVADAVDAVLSDFTWYDEPEIAMTTWRVPLGREVIGYEPGTFEYEFGAVYCAVSDSLVSCDGGNYLDALDESCLAFPPDYPAPSQTELSSGRIGDLHFLTFPGEGGTLLAEFVMDEIRVRNPDVGDIAFFGYAQDYLGYSILEEDWWNGGYESSGALWGPRQGEYLAQQSIEAFGWTFGDGAPTAEPPIIEPFVAEGFAPYIPTPGVDIGTLLVDVPPSVSWSDTLSFEVAGTDPWLGAPIATLLDSTGAPVLRSGGLPVDSDGQGFSVLLIPEPSYVDAPDAPSRTFRWVFELPIRHRQAVGIPDLDGSYQIEVSIPLDDGTLQTATTSPFTVSAQ